jgi:hypothetical protein
VPTEKLVLFASETRGGLISEHIHQSLTRSSGQARESAVDCAPTTPQKPLSGHPILWAAAGYGAGIIFGYYVWRPPIYWLAAGVAFSPSGAYFLRCRSKAAYYALALAALFVTGALMMQVRAPENQNSPFAFADGPTWWSPPM